jgi:putative ABC transport system ATP-binding protein/lipoprotein-releasing system ATP-binding protein
VFQTSSLFPSLTAAQNTALPLILAQEGQPPACADRVSAVLEAFGLSGLAHKLPEELSGGQAQRIAMARALAIGPKLVLADEPTGQLDSRTAQLFLDMVLERLAGTEAALVIATHDRDVAARMTTKWIMAHGRLFAEQTVG